MCWLQRKRKTDTGFERHVTTELSLSPSRNQESIKIKLKGGSFSPDESIVLSVTLKHTGSAGGTHVAFWETLGVGQERAGLQVGPFSWASVFPPVKGKVRRESSYWGLSGPSEPQVLQLNQGKTRCREFQNVPSRKSGSKHRCFRTGLVPGRQAAFPTFWKDGLPWHRPFSYVRKGWGLGQEGRTQRIKALWIPDN